MSDKKQRFRPAAGRATRAVSLNGNAHSGLAIGRFAITQTEQTRGLRKPKTRAILGLMGLNFLSVIREFPIRSPIPSSYSHLIKEPDLPSCAMRRVGDVVNLHSYGLRVVEIEHAGGGMTLRRVIPQCNIGRCAISNRSARSASRLSSVHNSAPGVISVDASRVISTNPHPSPYSFSRSINAKTSRKLA